MPNKTKRKKTKRASGLRSRKRKRKTPALTAKGGASSPTTTTRIIAQLRDDFGLTQPLFVRLSGFSPRSIASWSHGAKATKPAATRFVEIQRLLNALAKMAQSREDVVFWLQEPNDALNGSTPLQVIERGESDRLWHLIYEYRTGN